MAECLLLYIDILGFSEMAKNKQSVDEIYNIIDSLNVFGHAPSFKTIVFSDTVLVHSNFDLNDGELSTALMWMCEFAQDLFYRLITRDVHFRAIIRRGDFEHKWLNHIEAFHGQALIDAYNHEKEIQCMGLFLANDLAPYSAIFQVTPYDRNYHFVHIFQHMMRVSHPESSYPINGELVEDEGSEWFIAYVVIYLKNIHGRMLDVSLHPHTRAKYQGTWHMLRSRSAGLLDVLEKNGFDPRSISRIDWTEAMRRPGTSDGFYG